MCQSICGAVRMSTRRESTTQDTEKHSDARGDLLDDRSQVPGEAAFSLGIASR